MDTKDELERSTMEVEMHLDDFKQRMGQVIARYNDILSMQDDSQIRAYNMLTDLKKTKNTMELGGSFKRSLKATMTEEEKEKYTSKINEIIEKTQSEYPEDGITQDNIEEFLKEKSKNVAELIKECKKEIKQVSTETNHIVSSAIYCSPEELTGGKLNRSKDVLNIEGDIGDYTFAQSGTLIDNPYILRKSGKGVCQDRDICIPGEEDLVHSENGRAILSEPVYVYLMKTTQFEPVVSIEDREGLPQINFSGEWISDKDIDRVDMKVKKYTDVTEMLKYIQIFSVSDRETFENLADSSYEEKMGMISELIKQGRIHYINGECGINSRQEYLQDIEGERNVITKEGVIISAKKEEVAMEKENASEIIQQLEKSPEKISELGDNIHD